MVCTILALATAYYLIPKVLGRPIYLYYLSIWGFWALAIFYNWAGMYHLIGGPIPTWMISTGTVASLMMIIPVFVVAVNHHMSVVGFHKEVWRSPTLRFTVFGAISYTLASAIGASMALRSVSETVQFTHFTTGHANHGVYAFFSMIMFGGVYYMMPRLLKREWPSASLINVHFWGSAIGISVMLIALYIAGWNQGTQLNDASIPFIEVVQNTIPWLKVRSVSGLFLLVAHLAFALNFFRMLYAAGSDGVKKGAALLTTANEEGAA